MAHSEQPSEPAAPTSGPTPLPSATALEALAEAVRASGTRKAAGPQSADSQTGAEQALASLVLLRELREQLGGLETALIEAARTAGASWADLATPLGVASRQAAERRYLRLRPGDAGATGEQRIKATRDRRAADRTVTIWARDNAGELRRLAGQITALPDLPATAHPSIGHLDQALADNDAAELIAPLTATRPHLQVDHPELAAHIDTITDRTDELRQDSNDQRNS